MTDRERTDRHRLVTLALALIGGAVLLGTLAGGAFGAVVTMARWVGDAEWELT